MAERVEEEKSSKEEEDLIIRNTKKVKILVEGDEIVEMEDVDLMVQTMKRKIVI